MKKLKILFKISGDLIYDKFILEEIERAVKNYSEVGLIFGFGIILSEKLEEKKIPFSYINGIRETTNDGLSVAFEVSEEIRNFLAKIFPGVKLISPVSKVNGEIININGDELVIQNYESYDKIIIYTLSGRNKERFKSFDNVEIKEVLKNENFV